MKTAKSYDYFIGIDCGVNTGIAFWDKRNKKFITIGCVKIHEAFEKVAIFNQMFAGRVLVRVEDARLRTWFPKNVGKEQLQGAGSIKRDAKIWEDFLEDLKIDYELVAPKNNKTKVTAPYFKKLTKWEQKTNVHARDGAMLVFGF